MAARILLITLQQALRSVALLLFPLTFIALIAWATAGSSAGNTTDPIRAAAWLWLASHLVHFTLALPPAHIAGALTILPLGALIFPIMVIRNGIARSIQATQNPRGSRIFFALWYSLLAFAISWTSQSGPIKSELITSIAYPLVIAIVAGIALPMKKFAYLSFTLWSLVGILGIAAIASAFSLFAHHEIIKSLTVVDQPGWVGGALLLALQIGYLPNLAALGVGYFSGAGVTLGAHTALSPIHFLLHGIPAIPLLAAIPSGKHPLYLLSNLLIFAFTLAQMVRARRESHRYLTAWGEIAFSLICISAFGFLASGQLLTSEMNPVGVRWWYLDLIYLACALLSMALLLVAPSIFSWISQRRRGHQELQLLSPVGGEE